jgi:hypothetical protein
VSDHPEVLRLDRANRHGLVAGATGKTVSPVRGIYDYVQDRESAFEVLKGARRAEGRGGRRVGDARAPAARPSQGEQMVDAFARSMIRTIGTQVGCRVSAASSAACLGRRGRPAIGGMDAGRVLSL